MSTPEGLKPRILIPRSLIQACPDCGVAVVWPQNDVLLDWPAEPFDGDQVKWTVVRVKNLPLPFRQRTRLIAMPGNPSTDMQGHRLHRHQPPTSIVRKGRHPWQIGSKL